MKSGDISFTLPICVNNIATLTIIVMKAGVSIISYDYWWKWGTSLKMLPFYVKLPMANRSI